MYRIHCFIKELIEIENTSYDPYDVAEEYGTVIPGIKVHGFVPCADLDVGIPIYYGTKSKIGIVAQLKLSVAF